MEELPSPGLGSARVAPGAFKRGLEQPGAPRGSLGWLGSPRAMLATFTGRFCAPGRAPPEPSPLSLQPCGPQARLVAQGPSRAGDPSRVPEADGNQRAPVPQAGRSRHKRYMGHPRTANRGCSVSTVGLLFPFIPSDPCFFLIFSPPQMKAAPKKPRGASTS